MEKQSLDKRVRIGQLIDAYGELLTQKQRQFIEMHYDEDMSFQEIAETAGVSRQAIFDSVKNAIDSLEKMESKLKLVERNLVSSPAETEGLGNPETPSTPAVDDTAAAPQNIDASASAGRYDSGQLATLLNDLTGLKQKVLKQGVIYNPKWIIADIDAILSKFKD